MNNGFWWILLSVALYGALHSLLAGQPAKELAERWFGAAARRWYRLFFSLVGGVSFLPAMALVALLPDAPIYRVSGIPALVMMAVQFAGVVGVVYGVSQTGALVFLGLQPEPQPPVLVTGGLYRWVRHPLYTCSLLFIWLSPVMTWNILALNLGVTAYLLVGIRFEERKLSRFFGPAYAEYARRTPMLVPRVLPR